MSSRSHERRTERATAEEVAEVERQLWEFAKRIDPPGVPEAKLRPGAFLWRIHKTWHSLGRGTGGLASRSFRALRDELLVRDPPVRNLQPKLYGSTALSHAEAEQLIQVMLETWYLERQRNGKWQAKPLMNRATSKPAHTQDLDAVCENLLHTLFRGDDHLLMEEPVGVPPEIFFSERGRESLALIIPTKAETAAHLSPSNTYGGISNLVGHFFHAARERYASGQSMPLLIWVLRLRAIRETAEFHEAFHSLAAYSAALTNWYFRLSRQENRKRAEEDWDMIRKHGAFVVYGLPDWAKPEIKQRSRTQEDLLEQELLDIEPECFLPNSLPIVLRNHRLVRKHREQDFGLNVSIESDAESNRPASGRLAYWLFPDRPGGDLEETADTTGLPVFDAEISPGPDFDLAYKAVYEAVSYHLGFTVDSRTQMSFNTLLKIGWNTLTIEQFQKMLLTQDFLAN